MLDCLTVLLDRISDILIILSECEKRTWSCKNTMEQWTGFTCGGVPTILSPKVLKLKPINLSLKCTILLQSIGVPTPFALSIEFNCFRFREHTHIFYLLKASTWPYFYWVWIYSLTIIVNEFTLSKKRVNYKFVANKICVHVPYYNVNVVENPISILWSYTCCSI